MCFETGPITLSKGQEVTPHHLWEQIYIVWCNQSKQILHFRTFSKTKWNGHLWNGVTGSHDMEFLEQNDCFIKKYHALQAKRKKNSKTEMFHGQWCLSSRCTANHMRISGARKGRLSKWRGSHSRTWPALTLQHGINPIIFSHTASGSCYTGLFSRNTEGGKEEGEKEATKSPPTHRDSQLWTVLSVSDSAAVFRLVFSTLCKSWHPVCGGKGPQESERSDTRVLCSDLQTSAVLCANTWPLCVDHMDLLLRLLDNCCLPSDHLDLDFIASCSLSSCS